jgi:hypothetical protein
VGVEFGWKPQSIAVKWGIGFAAYFYERKNLIHWKEIIGRHKAVYKFYRRGGNMEIGVFDFEAEEWGTEQESSRSFSGIDQKYYIEIWKKHKQDATGNHKKGNKFSLFQNHWEHLRQLMDEQSANDTGISWYREQTWLQTPRLSNKSQVVRFGCWHFDWTPKPAPHSCTLVACSSDYSKIRSSP